MSNNMRPMIGIVDFESTEIGNMLRLWGDNGRLLWVGLDFGELVKCVRVFGINPKCVDLTSGSRRWSNVLKYVAENPYTSDCDFGGMRSVGTPKMVSRDVAEGRWYNSVSFEMFGSAN